MGIISKIILKSGGTYSATKKYEELDYVRYNGCTWVAKKETTGNTPPSSPDETSDYWALLARDGEYTGSMPTWTQLSEKPFETLNSEDFTVDSDNELKVNFPEVTEPTITSTSDKFTVTNKELDLKIDNNTIKQNSDGKLYANVTSAGFDIHSLDTVNSINLTDEFPLYSNNTSKTLKATFGTIYNRITADFTKIYDSARGLIGSTYIKDSVSEINNNSTPYQIAGAVAVKNIYQYIAPLPTEAPAYSSQNEYDKGAVVTYNGTIYYAKESVSKSSWNSSKWQAWTDNIPFRFGIDADGNYGYYKAGADSVTPFKTGGGGGTVGTLVRETVGTVSSSSTSTFDISTMFPSVDLTNVSEMNFAIVPTTAISNSYKQGSSTQYKVYVRATLNVPIPTLSYNSSTHKLSANSPNASAVGAGANSVENVSVTQTGNITYTIYFYHV